MSRSLDNQENETRSKKASVPCKNVIHVFAEPIVFCLFVVLVVKCILFSVTPSLRASLLPYPTKTLFAAECATVSISAFLRKTLDHHSKNSGPSCRSAKLGEDSTGRLVISPYSGIFRPLNLNMICLVSLSTRFNVAIIPGYSTQTFEL